MMSAPERAARRSRSFISDGPKLWLEIIQCWRLNMLCPGLTDITYAAVERTLREQGKSIPVRRYGLGRRLKEAGWLVETDEKQATTVKRRQRVFVMSRDAVLRVPRHH
jgi:hypothetical protein